MFYLICNPTSRSGNLDGAEARLRNALEKNGIPYRLAHTRYQGHAAKLAKKVCQYAAEDGKPASLIVLGGDGTINEAINGITDFSLIRFGVVPSGSGNDFLRGLGVNGSTDEIISQVLKNEFVRAADVGELTCETESGPLIRRFGVSAGIGFDAAICEEIDRSPVKSVLNKVRLGQLSYGVIGVKQVITAPHVSCEIELENGYIAKADRLLFTAVMNLPFEGGGYPFGPKAKPDDGLLDLMVADSVGGISALLLFPKAKSGKLEGTKGISFLKCAKAAIRTDAPLWVHTDGETLCKTANLTVRVIPSCLRLLI